MEKIYNIAVFVLSVYVLLWHPNSEAMNASVRPRAVNQFAKKRLEKIQDQNVIAIKSSQNTGKLDMVFINKDLIKMSNTLMSIMEGYGENSAEPIIFDLFSIDTIKQVFALLQHYSEYKISQKKSTEYGKMVQKIKQLSLEQLINSANMLDFLVINDSECPLMSIVMDKLADAISNLSFAQLSANKESIDNLNRACSGILSKKILSFLKISILKHHGVRDGTVLPKTISLEDRDECKAFSNDGKRVVVTMESAVAGVYMIVVYDTQTMEPLAELPYSVAGYIRSICFSNNDQKIVIVNWHTGDIVVWDATNYKQIDAFTHPGGQIRGALFGNDDKTIFSFSDSKQNNIVIWRGDTDAGKYRQSESLTDPFGRVDVLDISKNGRYFISGSNENRSIVLWNDSNYTIEDYLASHHKVKGIDFLKFSPDGAKIIVNYDIEGGSALWDSQERQIIRNLPKEQIKNFTSDGSMIISVPWVTTKKNVITLRSAATGEKICELKKPQGGISELNFINNDNTLVVITYRNPRHLMMINLFTPKEQEMFEKLKKQPLLDQVKIFQNYRAIQEKSKRPYLIDFLPTFCL